MKAITKRGCVCMASCLCVAILNACTTIPLPQSDNSPPSAQLIANLEVGGQVISRTVLTPNSGNIANQSAICPGDIIVLTANSGDSDGGVQSVRIDGQVTGTCGQIVQSFPPIDQRNTGPAASPGDNVPTERSTFRNVALADFTCSDGSLPNPLTGSIRAEAMNYFNGITSTDNYEFTYPPISRSCTNDPCFVPLNATLLDTKSESCGDANSVQVNAHVPREIIEAGECRAFAPKPSATPVQWWCVGPTEPIPSALNPNEADCPQGTNFIRVSRSSSGSSFTIECHAVP